jgi:DNA-binding transcriptional LysR family regulator
MLMDTRQLAAFCAVVERRSFSQAAERLGVTQPAVSLQVRSLEQRLGTQLLDRSGRRVEPTEAGLRLYASAQRLLALEEQLLEDVAGEGEGALTGSLELGASTGPGGTVVPLLLCDFAEQHPDVRVRLSVSDTQTVVDQVAERQLELGVVGAARRHRGVVFEPFFRDEVVLACPAGHRFAGKTITLDDLRSEPLIVMQEGAGVRQVIEDELRSTGTRLRDLDIRAELGLQESVRSAVAGGHGITFISRTALDSDLAAGTIATARVRGLDPVREIFLARAAGRTQTRAAQAFVQFAQTRLPS